MDKKLNILIEMDKDGKVTVSGNIQDPIFLMGMFSQAFAALSQYYAQETKIVKPQSSLILPG